MNHSYLEVCVYPQDAFDKKYDILPAIRLYDALEDYFNLPDDLLSKIQKKLEQSSRKLCMMWHASREALKAENDFYSTTIKDAPALFGEDAIYVHYHLESMVLLARSAMDVASTTFGWTLPDPFPKKNFDSFNKVLKNISKQPPPGLGEYINELRDDNQSWLSLIAGTSKGRSLRDKLSHQTSFPIQYVELYPPSEKEYPVVKVEDNLIPLEEFVDTFCHGVITGFLNIEQYCLTHIQEVNSIVIKEGEI
jgi:hypothetical protein